MSVYDRVQGNHPPKNRFDLSHTHFFTAKVGMLYPVMCKEMYPGDVFRVRDAVHAELQPLVAPLMSDLDMYCHTFFVPYRLLYGVDSSDGKSIWEKYITGGKDGDYDTPLPSWNPTFTKTGFTSETIWDSIGNPVNVTVDESDPDNPVYSWTPIKPRGLDVMKAPKLAYNFIYNNYYIQEMLQDEVDLENEDLLYVNWRKDYFTSCLEDQQLGTTPALELQGLLPIQYSSSPFATGTANSLGFDAASVADHAADSTNIGGGLGSCFRVQGGAVDSRKPLYVDVSNALTFSVHQMRLQFAMQRLLELTAQSGYRYTEFLKAHWSVSPSDARLDRPEYVGGCVFPVSISVNVQNSATGSGATPQGNKAGIGNINQIMDVGSYRAEEYGVLMTLVSIVPKPIYSQGISREWLRQNRWEFYSPEMAYLSEQGVYRAELYVDPDDTTFPDNSVFGYQAHWNELRASQNFITGAMRHQFDYWTISRKFASRPALNADFVSMNHPEEYNSIWAVKDEDQFIIAFSNLIDAFRPIPAMGTPGLIDHVYGGR